MRVNGGDETDATVIGYRRRHARSPASSWPKAAKPPPRARRSAAQPDLAVGDQVTIVTSGAAAPVSLSVVGVARDVELSVTPTLFTDLATYEAVCGP